MTGSTARTARDNPERHRFEVHLGDALAIAAYEISGGTIRFTHTAVPRSYEGQGIGTLLIEAGLAAARERGLNVNPACPFFAEYMKKHPETHDLLDPASRHELGLE